MEFDPAWEYHVPDAECLEVTTRAPAHPIHAVPYLGDEKMFSIRRSTAHRGVTDMETRFIELWVSGAPYRVIAEEMGFKCELTVRHWRDRLALPRRLPRRRRPIDQARYVASQVALRADTMRRIADIFLDHAEVDARGRHVNGTDKQTNHRYGDAYDSLLSVPEFYEEKGCPLVGCRPRSTRAEVRLVMEVGVAEGHCLLAWRAVFPGATVVGMDVAPAAHARGERIEFHQGDYRKREDCERAAAGRTFDLIVEDANHRLDESLVALFWLWPHVAPGGLYVIEEFAEDHGEPGRPFANVRALFPHAQIVETTGPTGRREPLVAIRKPRR